MTSICYLLDINDCKTFCIQESTSFNIVHLNIRSVLGKSFDELCSDCNELKPKISVIVFGETCLLPNENHPILGGNISYAVCISCNRNNSEGGLLVYVLDKLSSIKVEGMSKMLYSFESIGAEITLSANNVIYICGIYRPPWSKITDFNREFFTMTK